MKSSWVRTTKAECAKQLREGEPRIEVLEDGYPRG
jgi:hypothetical protein